MSTTQKKKNISIFGVVMLLVQTALVLALVVVSVLSFGARVPALARLGFNFFAVTSGSMEPKLPVGSLIYVGSYKLEDLKPGDIITYQKTNAEAKSSSIVTHRIASIDKKEDKQQTEDNGKQSEKVTLIYTIKTKGDANANEDEYTVAPGEVTGLYKWSLPKLGYVSMFAQSPTGFVALVILPAALLIIWEIASLILHFKHHYESKSQSEIAKLKEQLAQKEQKEMEHAQN
jgi:signal peptidase